jgi:hypothetical protein
VIFGNQITVGRKDSFLDGGEVLEAEARFGKLRLGNQFSGFCGLRGPGLFAFRRADEILPDVQITICQIVMDVGLGRLDPHGRHRLGSGTLRRHQKRCHGDEPYGA